MKAKWLLVCLLVISITAASAQANSLSNTIRTAVNRGISENQIKLVLDRAHAENISDAEIADMLKPMIKAKQNNVPVSLITNKIMEGLLKHAAPRRIADVANRLEQSYEEANAIETHIPIRAKKTDELRESMAIAIFNGVKPNELKSLYHAAPKANESYYVIGTISLISMISSGYSKKQSLSFMKKQFQGHKNIEAIQHETIKFIRQLVHDKNKSIEQGTGIRHNMEINRPEIPYKEPERVSVPDTNKHHEQPEKLPVPNMNKD